MGSLVKAIVPVNGVRKEILFFSNPSTKSGRFNMTIQASSDLGVSWPAKYRLLIDERIGFGYSSLTQIDAQTIGILYEGVRDLYFVKIAIKDIINSK
jgi:sialidase-1